MTVLTDEEIMDINQNAEFDSAIGYARRIEAAVLAKVDDMLKAERERCAKVCEELRHPDGYSGENVDWCAGTNHCAAAIRSLP